MTDFQKMKKKLYADSPFDLGTIQDDAYRDGVDASLEAFENTLYPRTTS